MIRRIIINILSGLICLVIFLLGLVFIVIEGRLLFSGDWLVYDNVVGGFFKYFFRLLIALFACTYSVTTYINFFKNSPKLSHYLYVGSACLFITGLIMSFTTTNYVDQASCIITSVLFLIKTTELTLILILKK